MTFEEILNQASAMLQRRGRVSYRTLKRHFDLDDGAIEDLKFEFVEVKKIAVEEEGSILAWVGSKGATDSSSQNSSRSQLRSSLSREQRQNTAERRQLTVMFIDLVGSTALSQRLDPEDLREVLYEYQDLFDSIVNRYQGLVVQHQGDGIVAYFGYPEAQEDDPRRAVMSGLQMLTALEELNQRISIQKSLKLQVRMGVHTGLVVVGTTGGSGDSLMHAIGEGPNLASRIQSEAKANTLVISEASNRLVSHYFETEQLGKYTLKGFSELVTLYRVIREKEWSSLDFAYGNNLTRLVGREEERKQILSKWELARKSQGQVVMVSGEAGIGKSRLVSSLVSEIPNGSLPLQVFRCSPYHRNTAFNPIVERLRHNVVVSETAGPEDIYKRLEATLHARGVNNALEVALFASMLSIPVSGGTDELNVSAEQRKSLTIKAVSNWLLVEGTPSLLLFEDLQWADPSTLELLNSVIGRISTTPVLLIVTFRPDFRPSWKIDSNSTQILLSGLSRAQTESMINQLANNLPAVVIQDLLAKTDGNPLFVEEVTKLLLESGVLEEKKNGFGLKDSLKSLAIPNTLQDSLMARLDRLGAAKEVAQIGATIGREFSYPLIRAISQLTPEVLDEHLSKLVAAQLLVGMGQRPNTIFTFKHALVQETAYMSLLRRQRKEFHRRIVETLEQSGAEVIKSVPELLAHHCTEAGLSERAIQYWRSAGEIAVSKSAHEEAIHHLNEGLTVLQRLPATQKRAHDEIVFQIALGVPLTALRGYGSQEVEHTYERARVLCEQAGATSQLVPALYGLWRYYLLRADYKKALSLSDRLKSLSSNSDDPVHSVVANRATGSTQFYLGNLDIAWSHLKEIIDSTTVVGNRAGTLLFDVVDAWVTARSYASLTLWLQGYPDKAKQQSQASIEAAEKLNHPFSITLTRSFASWLYQFRGEGRQTLTFSQEGLKLAKEKGFGFWVGWGQILEGWALDKEGSDGQLDHMKSGLEIWYATGSELGSSYFLFLMGERLLTHGNLEEARRCVQKAKLFVTKTGENWWKAEICRLEGMLNEASGQLEMAEACYREALMIATSQKARSLELRAASQLAKLLAETPKRGEAFHLLRQIVNWFEEGLELPDLVFAHAILNQSEK